MRRVWSKPQIPQRADAGRGTSSCKYSARVVAALRVAKSIQYEERLLRWNARQEGKSPQEEQGLRQTLRWNRLATKSASPSPEPSRAKLRGKKRESQPNRARDQRADKREALDTRLAIRREHTRPLPKRAIHEAQVRLRSSICRARLAPNALGGMIHQKTGAIAIR